MTPSAPDGRVGPDAITVRALTLDDVAAYRKLRLQALADVPRAFSASCEEDEALSDAEMAMRAAPAAPDVTVGAFAGNELIGMAGYVNEKRRKEAHKGTMVGVYVVPPWRSAKVGRQLVEAVIAHARGLGVILHCWVAADNAPARRLYRDRGFEPFGMIRDSLLVDGEYVDEEMLMLDLRPR